MAAIRKKPKMPPKAAKVSKGPKLPNFHSKVCTRDTRKLRKVTYVFGPWHGIETKVRLQVNDCTLVFTASGMTGRYRMRGATMQWESVNV